MPNHNAFGLMLAVSLSFGAIAGCQMPFQTVATAQQQAGTQAGQHTAQAMAEDHEADYYGFIAEAGTTAAGYAVLATEASPSPSPSASASPGPSASPSPKPSVTPRPVPSFTPRVAPTPRPGSTASQARPTFKGTLPAEVKAQLDERQARLRGKAKARTDKMTAEKEAIGKATRTGRWVKGSDGTESQTVSFSFEKSVNGQGFSRSATMTRVRKADDKTLVSAHHEFSSNANGVTRKVVRDKTLNEDGSYTVVFHSEIGFKDGSKRTADWTKTIAADGSVSGTGTIVWTGKTHKAINLTFGGTEEAETAKSTDAETRTETTVTTTAEGEAKAVVKTESGATAEVKVEADADAPAVTSPESAS